MAGRKTKPAEGERCQRGHDPESWYQQSSTGKWICRKCVRENRKEYEKHIRATQPEKWRERVAAQSRAARASRKRRRDAQAQQLPPESA